MNRKVQWNSDALPYEQTIERVLYEMRSADAGENLLLDAVSIQDILEDSDGFVTLDALVTPFVKLQRKMEILQDVMSRAGETVKPVAVQVTEPFKQRGVANVAAIFELSDGQTVSVFFHNPDVTPTKMSPTDEVISWKWLLNKKDITVVVAPERGEDLNVREVARRIIKLAQKNSAAFQRANGKRSERMQAIQGLKDEITGLEAELSIAQKELEVAKVAAETTQQASASSQAANAPQPDPDVPAPQQSKEQELIDAYIKAWAIEAAQINAVVAAINWDGIVDSASANAEIQRLRQFGDERNQPTSKARAALEAIGINTWEKQWDHLHNTTEVQAREDAWKAYFAAVGRLEALAKAKMIEAGKAELAALPKGAPTAEIVRAVFRKHGIEAGGKWVDLFVEEIESKNVPALRDRLRSNDNKASAEIFERVTGVKLSSAWGTRSKQIDEWAGITPAQRAEKESAKSAAEQEQSRQKAVKNAWAALGALRVRNSDTGTALDGQQYLLGRVAEGYTEADKYKRGAATVYGLQKGGEFISVKSTNFNAFLKAALEFGGLIPALKLAGAAVPEPRPDETIEDQKIAAVDGAYLFKSATDKFKLWVNDSMLDDSYSPFASAKAMDEAAKRRGATIAWKMPEEATLDDVGQAVASLEDALAVIEGKEIASLGQGDNALTGLAAQAAKSIRVALASLTGEDEIAFNEAEIGGTFEAETVRLDSVMASQQALQGKIGALDSAAGGPLFVVGRIKLGSEVIGRIDMGGDGKAMVYVGAEGDQRVRGPSGRDAMYSDDNAPDMVDWLFAMRQADQAAPQPAASSAVAPTADASPAKQADRALLQSVITGTVADILAPELADALEAVYNRNQNDPELTALFEQAVAAYEKAMMAATANLT